VTPWFSGHALKAIPVASPIQYSRPDPFFCVSLTNNVYEPFLIFL
jgi:hypothetical protein